MVGCVEEVACDTLKLNEWLKSRTQPRPLKISQPINDGLVAPCRSRGGSAAHPPSQTWQRFSQARSSLELSNLLPLVALVLSMKTKITMDRNGCLFDCSDAQLHETKLAR